MTRYKVYDIIIFIRGGKMKSQYNKTITACFVGYIVQAIVNNFTPLLFYFFRNAIIFQFPKLHC